MTFGASKSKDKITPLEILLDIRALLYLAELRSRARTPGTFEQSESDVDAAITQARKRLGE